MLLVDRTISFSRSLVNEDFSSHKLLCSARGTVSTEELISLVCFTLSFMFEGWSVASRQVF